MPTETKQTAMDQNHNVSTTRPENGQPRRPPPTSSSSCGPKVDKAKFAGKGADLLHTASSFGKGKKLGKYLGKAENYLRKYHNTHSTNTPPANTVPLGGHPPTSAHHGNPPHGHPAAATTVPVVAYPATFGASADQYPSPHPSGGNGYGGGVHGNSGSGFGDYLKKASGFLKKH